MVWIKYKDRIHNKTIDLEVSEEVARFLNSNKVNEYRQYVKVLDNEFYSDKFNEWIENVGNEELLADEIVERQELCKLVRKYIAKQPKQKQEIVYRLFYLDQPKKLVAKAFELSLSAFSQQLDMLKIYMAVMLLHDKNFTGMYKVKVRKIKDCINLRVDENGQICSLDENDNVKELIELLGKAMDESEKQERIFKKFSKVS